MNTLTLDMIVKNMLMKRGYSIHWWIDFAVYCKDGLRELCFDLPLNPVRYKVLPLNDNHAIEIPDDYIDWAGVFVRRDQYLIPLVEDPTLDLVPNYDSNFDIQPYSEGVATQTDSSEFPQVGGGYLSAYWWFVNWDALGENLGRQFGGIGNYSDTFKVNKNRNEIKINENLCVNEIVLEYIGSGADADSATRINSYAQATLESYILWQFKEANRTYSEGEAQIAKRDYEQQFEILRARLSDLTLDRLKRIVQRNSVAIKY